MSSGLLSLYIVPCITEGIDVESDYRATPPTVCPHNNTHTIDVAGIRVIATATLKIVKIDNNSSMPNGGIYRADQYELSVAGGTGATGSLSISYPYNIDIFSVIIMPTPLNVGDNYSVMINPGATAGGITTALSPSSTELTLATGDAANLNPGFLLSISDGVNTDNLGIITSITPTGGVDFSIPNVDSFATGATAYYTVPRITNGKIVNSQNIQLGLSTINATGLKANSVAIVNYTNSTGDPKTLDFIIELNY